MTKYIALSYCLFFSVFCLAQDETDWAIASYKNGSVYIGKKIGEEKGMVQMRIFSGDTITINKYVPHRYYDSDNAHVFSNGKFFRTKNLFWTLNFGANFAGGDGDNARESAHFEFLYGDRLTPRLDVALGAGSEFNQASVAGFQFDTQFLALFAYGRYFLTNHQKRLFVFARAGYGFSTDEPEENGSREHGGGINAKYGLGIQFASRKKSKFQISLGHYFQKTSGQESFLDLIGNEINTEYDILLNRMIISFGWDF